MNDTFLDTFAKRLASRRSVIRATGTGLLAGIAGGSMHASAQDSTPEPADDVDFLFVQTATSGSITPNGQAGTPAIDGTPTPGVGADYVLTLEGHHGGTVYFSDRPDRIFGEAPTDQFLDALGFTPTNPPNAALVTGSGDGEQTVVVLELLDPAYDAASGTLSYGANILSEYEGDGLAHAAAQQGDNLPASFDRASLFIDDCPDITGCLTLRSSNEAYDVGPIPGGPYGKCWNWSTISCEPCGYSQETLNQVCDERYPEDCETYGCTAA